MCKAMRPRGELLRVVRAPGGEVSVDPSGHSPGRGCYVCLSDACITKGVKTRFVNRAFKCNVPDEVYTKVLEYYASKR